MKQGTKLSGPNIILITIDSLRYNHLGCYGYHRNTSPNIDALAGRGVKFTQAISNGSQTPMAFPAILASALPVLVNSENNLMRQDDTLAEILKKYGYHTAAFTPSPDLTRFYGYNRGFDVFHDSFRQLSSKGLRIWARIRAKSKRSLDYRILARFSWLFRPLFLRVQTRSMISADEITNEAMSWLETNKDRFFLWLHYMDVHQPYMPEETYLKQFCDQPVSRHKMYSLWRRMIQKRAEISPAEREIIINLYDADIKYTDTVIGSLLDRLGNRLAGTIVVITADHGEELGEHGNFGHHSMYDGILRVPLIIAGPKIKSGISVNQQVSLIDLTPTIVDLIEGKIISNFHGRSLIPSIPGEDNKVGIISTFLNPRVAQRSIAYRIPEWKYICTDRLDDRCPIGEEVYSLVDDPGEMMNLHNQDNDEANRFELAARQKIAQFKQLKAEENTAYEKKRIRAKLNGLGKM